MSMIKDLENFVAMKRKHQIYKETASRKQITTKDATI